jgi:hypothetical protein
MSSPELIEPHAAEYRLADEWGIPYPVAGQIVRGVLHGGQCYVRGRRLGEPLRDVSKEIAAAMSAMPSTSMIPWGFTDVEIDWRGLIVHGRPLVPTAYEHDVAATKKPRSAKPDADYERRATDLVIGLLKANGGMTRENARQACKEKFPELTDRAFERRIWRGARKALGLGRAMSPGRPKL